MFLQTRLLSLTLFYEVKVLSKSPDSLGYCFLFFCINTPEMLFHSRICIVTLTCRSKVLQEDIFALAQSYQYWIVSVDGTIENLGCFEYVLLLCFEYLYIFLA